MTEFNTSHSDVQEYYGKTLENKDDLKTSACCTAEAPPEQIKSLLKNIDNEIHEKFYGCGSPIPQVIKGATVLDLGCGTGRDCYLLSQLVGESGKVIGIDMTEEQLYVAKKHLHPQMEKFGYKQANVEFHQGYIEDLNTIGIKDNSIDVVISNCVINLSPFKEKVFKEIFRVLKPGGEIYFSDVFSGSRIPKVLMEDAVLLGECLSGAMYIEDFRRMVQSFGCQDPRFMEKSTIELQDPDVQQKIGMVDFYSYTMRVFKLDLEDICENYGQVAYYKGTIKESPHQYVLDDHHTFKKGLPYPVCGNTAKMLNETRLKEHFDVKGDMSNHYGPFDCAPNQQKDSKSEEISSSSSCC